MFKITNLHTSIWLQQAICMQACAWAKCESAVVEEMILSNMLLSKQTITCSLKSSFIICTDVASPVCLGVGLWLVLLYTNTARAWLNLLFIREGHSIHQYNGKPVLKERRLDDLLRLCQLNCGIAANSS